MIVGIRLLVGCLAVIATTLSTAEVGAADRGLDDTGGFVNLSPGLVQTTNGCSEFSVQIVITVTDARVFGLRFYFDAANLQKTSVVPGSDARLHLMPDTLIADTLMLDGFFHPNFPAGSVTIATLNVRAISPDDTVSLIGFTEGQGFSGSGEAPEPIIFSGDSTIIMIEGSVPLAPQGLIIVPFPPAQVGQTDSLRIQWKRVRRDVDGGLVTNPLYTVFFWDVKKDTSFIITTTYDTFLYNDYIRHSYDPGDTGSVHIGQYWVTACKTQP
jgi:hypothetical protein